MRHTNPPGHGSPLQGGRYTRGVGKVSTADQPLITVITVVRNHVASIEQTVISVLGQDYGNIEYIVLDGASTDGTLDVIRRYDFDIDYWASRPDNGVYDALNKAIAVSAGEYVGVIHAGSCYRPDTVSHVVQIIRSHGVHALIAGSAEWAKPQRVFRRSKMKPLGPDNTSILHETLFFPRALLNSLGSYNARFRISADLDLLMRAVVDHNVPVLYQDDIFVEYRESWGLSGRLRNQLRKYKEHYWIQSRYLNGRAAFHRFLRRCMSLAVRIPISVFRRNY